MVGGGSILQAAYIGVKVDRSAKKNPTLAEATPIVVVVFFPAGKM